MKSITKDKFNQLVNIVGYSFPSFGGGQTSNYNPLVNILKDKELQFAAGVQVGSVITCLLRELKIEVK